MSSINIKPLWLVGFRPFFLGASTWAALSMLVWLGLTDFAWSLNLNDVQSTYWHAHEMIFGYSVAVIAGFLLTAVPGWTSTEHVNGSLLILIFVCWLIARLSFLFGDASWLLVTGLADLIFMLSVFTVIAIPILNRKQFRQSGILVKILLMIAANVCFYLGATDLLEHGIYYGLYGGFYLIIALILTMARRVMPMFIRNGLSLTTPLRNRDWVDRSSIVLFLCFWALELSQAYPIVSSLFALLLFVVHAIRLYDWTALSMWRKSLVWVLYVSYLFIVLGFAAKASSLLGFYIAPTIGLHLFAIGGIGLITIGMMSRVALGHTGRDIHQPSRWLIPLFLCIITATILRVFLPIYAMQHYSLWMTLSKVFWIIGFTGFIIIYSPFLLSVRADHQQ